MFNPLKTDHEYGEFQSLSLFWSKCDKNFIDDLFPSITVEMILSTYRKNENDIDYQYRRDVLIYCCNIATVEQRNKLIYGVEKEICDKKLSDDEYNKINVYLAALGREDSIRKVINSYLNGSEIPSRHSFNNYPLNYLKQSSKLLKDFTELYIYSMGKNTERRYILLNIAQAGIKQHITQKCFKHFKNKINKEIKKNRKIHGWKSENYKEFLLEIEQQIFP